MPGLLAPLDWAWGTIGELLLVTSDELSASCPINLFDLLGLLASTEGSDAFRFGGIDGTSVDRSHQIMYRGARCVRSVYDAHTR